MGKVLQAFARDESGASAIEYGILTAMISCFIITALRNVGTKVAAKFAIIGTALN